MTNRKRLREYILDRLRAAKRGAEQSKRYDSRERAKGRQQALENVLVHMDYLARAR